MFNYSDVPYNYYPPKYNKFLVFFIRDIGNRFYYLKSKIHLIKKIDIIKDENFLKVKKYKRNILFLPNHPSHSDPQILAEMFRRLKTHSFFMASYDLFERRTNFEKWVMQTCGTFSVDKDSNDTISIKEALNTLTNSNYNLTIFPEGNAFLQNDVLMPFMPGAVFIGLQAERMLKKQNSGKSILFVPVSIKVTFIQDVREKIKNALIQIAENHQLVFDKNNNICLEISKLALSILNQNLQKRGYGIIENNDNIDNKLKAKANEILDKTEKSLGVKLFKDSNISLFDKISDLRRHIHSIMLNEEKKKESYNIEKYNQDVLLAFKILTYSFNYISSNPTLDRIGEVAGRLYEDLNNIAVEPFGNRKAIIKFGEPVEAKNYYDAFLKNSRNTMEQVTEKCSNSIQKELDYINSVNKEIGSTIF